MPWEDLIIPFGDVLYARMRDQGLTVRAFAEKAGISTAFLSKIANRLSPPPLDRMEGWADILGLIGDSREYFLDLAALEVVPPRAKRLFEPWRPGFKAIQAAIDRQCAADGRTYPYPELLGTPDEDAPDAGIPAPTSPVLRAAQPSAVYLPKKSRKWRDDGQQT